MPTIKVSDLKRMAIERLKYMIEKIETNRPFTVITLESECTTNADRTGHEERIKIHVEGMEADVKTPIFIEREPDAKG